MNKPSQISPHEVLQSWLINTIQHLLVMNEKGEEGALKEGGLINVLPLKKVGAY